MPGQMTIVKIKLREDGYVELYKSGHKYKDLLLFEPGDLWQAGIDPNELTIGVTTPCSFVAHYEESDNLKESGQPHLDVVSLSLPEEGQSVTRTSSTSVSGDGDAVVKGLRALYTQQKETTNVLKSILDQLCTQTDQLDSMGNKLARIEDHLSQIESNTKGD